MEAHRFKNHLKRYGLTPEEYHALAASQQELCMICGEPETERHPRQEAKRRLSVDHDHSTGKLRGLLCRRCNRALGGFKEDTELMRKAISYLEAARELV